MYGKYYRNKVGYYTIIELVLGCLIFFYKSTTVETMIIFINRNINLIIGLFVLWTKLIDWCVKNKKIIMKSCNAIRVCNCKMVPMYISYLSVWRFFLWSFSITCEWYIYYNDNDILYIFSQTVFNRWWFVEDIFLIIRVFSGDCLCSKLHNLSAYEGALIFTYYIKYYILYF